MKRRFFLYDRVAVKEIGEIQKILEIVAQEAQRSAVDFCERNWHFGIPRIADDLAKAIYN